MPTLKSWRIFSHSRLWVKARRTAHRELVPTDTVQNGIAIAKRKGARRIVQIADGSLHHFHVIIYYLFPQGCRIPGHENAFVRPDGICISTPEVPATAVPDSRQGKCHLGGVIDFNPFGHGLFRAMVHLGDHQGRITHLNHQRIHAVVYRNFVVGHMQVQ